MSYISITHQAPAPAAATMSRIRPLASAPPRINPSPAMLISTGLEAGLGLAIMSGLSLVLCTIAAGAL